MRIVQTLFSTQLFYLTPDRSLEVSPHIWVLFAISVPFTILTMVWWVVRKRQHEAKRRSLYDDKLGRDQEKGM
jgi:uncharacterized membrane-anchored protein